MVINYLNYSFIKQILIRYLLYPRYLVLSLRDTAEHKADNE